MRFIRPLLYLCIGLLLGANVTLSYAAFGRASSPGFTGGAGGAAWTGKTGQVSNGAALTIESINVGGKYISVPHLGPLGAAAVETAILGLKATPQAFLTSAVITYLGSKGLELLQGAWKSHGTPIPETPGGTETIPAYQDSTNKFYLNYGGVGTYSQCVADHLQWLCGNAGGTVEGASSDSQGNQIWTAACNVSSGTVPRYPTGCYVQQQGAPCAAGYTQSGNTCTKTTQPSCPSDYTSHGDGTCWPNTMVDASESDWDKFRGVLPPDQVMDDLCKSLGAMGAPCKVGPIVQTPVTVPLGDWKTDPLTGQKTRAVAKISPGSTKEDPTRVEISTETETETPATTDPVTGDPVPAKTETKKNDNEDFCTLHPEAMGCQSFGEPEAATALDQKELGVSSVTPVTFGSANSCPADVALPKGAKFSYEWPCRMAIGLKPFLLVLAWLLAGFIVMGVVRND